MIAARKFESFCIEPTERWMFAGNASGQIACIDIDTFTVRHEVQAHAGIIQAIASHPCHPYVAALSTDRHVSVWRYDNEAKLAPVCNVSLRALKPDNDAEDVPYVHSTSQALGFHDTQRRIVTRSANAGLLELAFCDNGTVEVLRCQRVHDNADLISARYAKDSDCVPERLH